MVLFINACARSDSRTLRLGRHVLRRLGKDYEELVLDRERIQPLYSERLAARDALIGAGKLDDEFFKYARQFAEADEIVVAVPYWALSFSAVLKNYIEAINVIGITFSYSDMGVPGGLCRAKRLIYVTTAGGQIYNDELGFGYIKTLCRTFYGIGELEYFKAEGLDVAGADVEGILCAAEAEIDEKLTV